MKVNRSHQKVRAEEQTGLQKNLEKCLSPSTALEEELQSWTKVLRHFTKTNALVSNYTVTIVHVFCI